MASYETLNKMSLAALTARYAKMYNGIAGDMTRADLVGEMYEMENSPFSPAENEVRSWHRQEMENIALQNAEDAMSDDIIGINEISESGELAAHNIERTISSMKTARAAVRKMIDASIVNVTFTRTLTTINGAVEATVKFDKANKVTPFEFSTADIRTNDQRGFYSYLRTKFALPNK